MSKLDNITSTEDYDDESKTFLASLRLEEKEIGEMNSMKMSQGWKTIERKTREELAQRIEELVKDDPKVSVLLALLNVADTKTREKALQEEIARILPESG